MFLKKNDIFIIFIAFVLGFIGRMLIKTICGDVHEGISEREIVQEIEEDAENTLKGAFGPPKKDCDDTRYCETKKIGEPLQECTEDNGCPGRRGHPGRCGTVQKCPDGLTDCPKGGICTSSSKKPPPPLELLPGQVGCTQGQQCPDESGSCPDSGKCPIKCTGNDNGAEPINNCPSGTSLSNTDFYENTAEAQSQCCKQTCDSLHGENSGNECPPHTFLIDNAENTLPISDNENGLQNRCCVYQSIDPQNSNSYECNPADKESPCIICGEKVSQNDCPGFVPWNLKRVQSVCVDDGGVNQTCVNKTNLDWYETDSPSGSGYGPMGTRDEWTQADLQKYYDDNEDPNNGILCGVNSGYIDNRVASSESVLDWFRPTRYIKTPITADSGTAGEKCIKN